MPATTWSEGTTYPTTWNNPVTTFTIETESESNLCTESSSDLLGSY